MESNNLDFFSNSSLNNPADTMDAQSMLGFDTQRGQSNQLVVIAADVDNYEQLIQGLSADTAVLMLDSKADSIFQIDSAINQFQSLSALHIVSHGSSGQLSLGSTTLNAEALEFYEDTIKSWDNVLTDTADILLYGCNVGEGLSGYAFLEQFAQLVGADVSASDNVTGSANYGGDWELEVTIGTIEVNVAFQPDVTALYTGILHEGHFHNDYVVQTDGLFQKETFFSALKEPTSISSLPNGRMLILGKAGDIRVFDTQNIQAGLAPYLDLTSKVEGGFEAGLLDITLDPNFESNGYFYVYYSHKDAGDGRFRISRFTDNGSTADLSSEFIVWERPESITDDFHQGGGLDMGPDGKLYLTIGEEFNGASAQDLTHSGGKVIRINTDGTIPIDNPFADGPGGNLDEIWAYGLRNPFRVYSDAPTGRIFITEVGGNIQETAQEDIHLGEAGANFGWPQYEGISNDPAVSDPIFTYDHNDVTPQQGSVIGGVVYRGNQLPIDLNGAYFFGDYSQGWVRYLKFDEAGEIIDADVSTPEVDAFNFDNDADTVVDFEQGIDGSLYYVTYGDFAGSTGTLSRVSYNLANQAPVISEAATEVIVSNATSSTVSFQGTATDDDGDPLTYTWVFGDGTSAGGADVTHTYTGAGIYTAFLQVSDGFATTTSNPIILQVGNRPEATILTPNQSDPFRAGQTILFTADGMDLDETLTDANFSWSAKLIHNDHEHPGFNPVTGKNYSFKIPTTGHGFSDNVGYRVTLTVTDSDGLFDTKSINIFPAEVDLSFSSNVPGDVNYTINNQSSLKGPFTLDQAIGFKFPISVPEVVVVDGVEYTFESWSNGVTTPRLLLTVPELNQAYSANYVITNTNVSSFPVTDGLVLRLEADSGVTTNGGNLVTGWSDLSGSGNDLIGAGDPRLVSNGLNGQPVIAFDGDGDKLERTIGLTGLPTGGDDRTIFVLANYKSNGYGGFAYGSAELNQTFGLAVDNDGDLLIQAWGNGNDNTTDVNGTGVGWLTQSAKLSGGNLTHYKDGVEIDSSSHAYNTSAERLVLGAEIDSSPYLDMEVAAVLVFDRALSEAEREQVEAYLQQKYFASSPPSNAAPVANNDADLVTAGGSIALNVLANDTDDSGLDVTTVSIVSGPSNGAATVDPVTGQVSYTHDGSGTTVDSFTYTVADGAGLLSNVATVNLTIEPNDGNTAPVASDDVGVTDEEIALVVEVLNNDTDVDGDRLELVSFTQPTNGSVTRDNNGTPDDLSDDRLVYLPALDFAGSDFFNYTIEDGNGGTDTATVSVTVTNINDAPIATNDAFTVGVDSTTNLLDVLFNDADVDSGDSVTIVGVGPTSKGGSVSINSTADGIFYTPVAGSTETETFTYMIADAAGETSTSTATVSVVVSEASALPVTSGLVLYLEADSGVTTNGGNLVTGWSDLSGSGNDLIGAGDPRLVSNGLNGQPVIAFDGDGDKLERTIGLTGLPTGGDDRTIFVLANYKSNGYGGFAYGSAELNQTFGLAVDNDGDLLIQAWGNGNDNTTDVNGTGVGWLTQSAKLSGGNLTHYKDGVEIDSSSHAYNTSAERLVLGAEIDSSPYLDMEVAAVLVFDRALSEAEREQVEAYLQQKYFASSPPSNAAPVANNDADLVTAGGSIALNVLANDTDDSGLDVTTVSIVSGPSNGAATVDPVTGQVSYTHDGSGTTVDSFTYTVADGAGLLSNVATVNLTIEPNDGNTAPVASDDVGVTDEEIALVVEVLNNDTDVDGDRLELVSFTQPTNGSVTRDNNGTPDDLSDDRLVYLPALDFAGSDFFNYTIEDGNGGTDTATVSVTVTNINDAPIATNDAFTVGVDSTTNLLDVLFNDADVDSGDSVTIVGVGPTSKGGSVSINSTADGIFYTPVAGSTETETFTYMIADAAGETSTSTATVSVVVSEASALPVTSGLVLYLEADSGVTTNGGNLVTGWSDLSGSGNDLIGAGDPRLVSNGLNGQPVIAFDGDGDKLERTIGLTGLPTGGDDRTIFVLANYKSNGYGGFAYGSAELNQTFGLAVDNDGDLLIQAWGNGNDNTTDVNGTGVGWLTQSAKLSGGNLTHYKDGVEIDSSSHAYNTSAERLVLGAEIDSSPYLDMEVAAVLVFDRALSEAERQEVENYLKAKYAL